MITAGFSSRVGMETGPEVPRPTQDVRPQLDRPSRRDNGGSRIDDDDDPIKGLRAADQHDPGDHHGGSGDPSGSGDTGSHSSGSDSGDHSSGSSSDGGSSGSDGGSGSGDDHHHGGRPPEQF
jgi:hypothetical protein